MNERASQEVDHPEFNSDINKFTENSLGFSLSEIGDMKTMDMKRPHRDVTAFEKGISLLKKVSDPFTLFSNFLKRYKFELPGNYEEQGDDVNWDALQWDMNRWNGDNDTLVPRVTQEFPRISSDYTSQSDANKPWGEKQPSQFNWEDSPKLQKFDKGKWFYTHVEQSTHLDLCGWPNLPILRQLRVLLGIENRHEFSKQLFDRLYSLEF